MEWSNSFRISLRLDPLGRYNGHTTELMQILNKITLNWILPKITGYVNKTEIIFF